MEICYISLVFSHPFYLLVTFQYETDLTDLSEYQNMLFFTKFIRFLFNYACLLTFNILQVIDQYVCLTNHHSCSNSSYLNSFHMYVVQLENHGQPACDQQHSSVGCVLSDVLGSRQCIKVTSATENSCSSHYKCASQFGSSAERYAKQR